MLHFWSMFATSSVTNARPLTRGRATREWSSVWRATRSQCWCQLDNDARDDHQLSIAIFRSLFVIYHIHLTLRLILIVLSTISDGNVALVAATVLHIVLSYCTPAFVGYAYCWRTCWYSNWISYFSTAQHGHMSGGSGIVVMYKHFTQCC